MNSRSVPLTIGIALLSNVFICIGQTNTTTSKRAELSDFKIVYERNIFNPKRSARGTPEPKKDAAKPVRVDSLSLVGIMAYEKGTYVFFDGSSSNFRKTIKAGETIAGLQLARIEPSHVVLRSETNELVLRVGSQLRREDGGLWKDGGRVEASENYVSSSRPTAPPNPVPGGSSSASASNDQPGGWPGFFPGGPPPGGGFPGGPFGQQSPPAAANTDANNQSSQAQSPPASGGSQDDVLRRLMERRQQEQNR